MIEEQKGKVLIAAPVDSILTDGLAAAGYTLVREEKITQATAFGLIHDCVGVITSTRLQLNKELIDAAPGLKWIGRMGSGMEVVDVAYAAEKNIACYSSPEGNSNAVAEHALGMLLGLTKKIVSSQEEVKQGLWLREKNRGIELEGKTIGIIGFGHTGRAFAKKLSVFDTQILVYDKYKQEDVPPYVQNCSSLAPIFQQADIISFHVPIQKDTVYYLDDKFITDMSKAFIVINTSRGIVVNSKALLKGLQNGKVSGACLDVWEEEPLDAMSGEIKEILYKVVALPQTIITPHIAGYSKEALYKMSRILLDWIIRDKK
jgi:D-3-phosphoglycerate dehydrogenase